MIYIVNIILSSKVCLSIDSNSSFDTHNFSIMYDAAQKFEYKKILPQLKFFFAFETSVLVMFNKPDCFK